MRARCAGFAAMEEGLISRSGRNLRVPLHFCLGKGCLGEGGNMAFGLCGEDVCLKELGCLNRLEEEA